MGAAAQTDIVARLQLRAEQFSSEAGRAFADMATRARASSQDVRASFSQSFSEVQKLAEQALRMPRTAAGALDLSGEIASLRTAAQAADQKAMATRELSSAMMAAAGSERTVTEAMRLEADAAMVAARGEEAAAAALRQRILALEAVQTQLNGAASATGLHTRAANDNAAASANQQQSTMMLGQQIQDFTVQVANGGNVATAFSQQIGQVGFALTGMGGKLGTVGAFLGTGWGTAVMVGLTVLGPLVSKIMEGNNALQDATDKLKKEAEQTAATARAQEAFNRTLEGRIALQAKLNGELDQSIKSERQLQQASLDKTRGELSRMRIDQASTEVALQAAKAAVRTAQAAAPETKNSAEITAYRQRVADAKAEVTRLTTQLALLNKTVPETERALREARIPFADRDVAGRLDTVTAAVNRHAEAVDRLRAAYANGEISGKTYEREKESADRALERARETARQRTPSLGTQLTTEQGGRILSSAQSFLGARENTASGRATLKELFVGAGINNLDPEKTAWCAAFVNAVLAGQGIRGTGNLAARSFLNYGTATSKPTEGDVVVLRRGNGAQGHVGFYAGQGAGGRILVTGGNQGNGVSTAAFDRRDVLGFRRAPTESASYKAELKAQADAAREAEQEQKRLAASLEQMLGTLDPAADAVRLYREELVELGKLQAAGKISGDDQMRLAGAAKRDFNEAQTRIAGDRFRDIMGADEIDSAIAQWQAGIGTASDLFRQDVEAAGFRFGDQVRSATVQVLDMFDVRVTGPLGGSLRGLLQPGGFEGQGREIADTIVGGLRSLKVDLAPEAIDRLTGKIGGVLSAAAYGDLGGSAFAAITGGKQSKLGGSLGGVLGSEAGKELGGALTKEIGGSLGKMLGGAAGPLGAIAGGVVGSVIGGMFRKVASGSAGISVANGSTSAGKAGGNDKDATSQAASLAGSVAQGLQSIASTLGARITGVTDVKIGTYDGKWRVNDHGGAIGGVKGSGAISFDTQEQAISYAISDALKDGVLSGISSASLAILRSGQDLSAAIQKAGLIEQIPKDLKAMLDPVGAAVDELNAKFRKTVDALNEGGASAEQMAQAQRLYDLQLTQVKNSTASASQGLKDFLTSLKVGSSSPYSLRDQEETAKAALKPYLDQIAAGTSVDQAKYQAAASAYLDVERQLYGSTQAYFDALGAVQAATNVAISAIDNAAPLAGGVDSPFVRATADSTAKTADGVQAVAEMSAEHTELLARVASAVEHLAARGMLTDGDFIGADRAFAVTS